VIDELDAERRVVVCCGSGGVGKTTISAAIAYAMAARGRRAVVVTIDPARRLATALGMTDLGDDPRRVPPERFAAEGLDVRGELWALQLDAKATFDRLVARHAPTPAARDRILDNRIYRHLSGAVAGAQEYMAVERLYELVEHHGFDRIVLDTPPAENALDFLDAPDRITRFIEGRALRLLLRPEGSAGRLGWRALHAGSTAVLAVLERVTGAQLLRDVADFLASFEGMYSGFAERAQAVRRLLLSPQSGFVVVSAPEPDPVREAVRLTRRLEHDGFPLGGVVLNRFHALPPSAPVAADALVAVLAAAGAEDPEGLSARVVATLAEAQVLGLRDLDALEALSAAMNGAPIARVPAFAREPVELSGLAEVAAALG
jgi:anion-transporting  ArsA/GET3 family ATPase